MKSQTQYPQRSLFIMNATHFRMDNTSMSLQFNDFDFENNGIEFALFYGICLVPMFMAKHSLDGRLNRITKRLYQREYHELIPRECGKCFDILLNIVSRILINIPMLTLMTWSAAMILRDITIYNKSCAAGLAVLFCGIAFYCFVQGLLSLVWQNFQFHASTLVYLLGTILSMFAYQYITIFMTKPTEFSLSAIFLASNCLVMIIVVFLNNNISRGSIEEVIKKKLPARHPPNAEGISPTRNPEREIDFQDEIKEERRNKEYFPCQDDIYDLFTIGKAENQDMKTAKAFGPGLQQQYKDLPQSIRRVISLTLWTLSIGFLVGQALITGLYFPERKYIGWFTTIAVLSTDIIQYFIYMAKIVKSAAPLALTLLINRFMMLIFSGEYSIYGYIILYLIYGVILALIISKRRFPFDEDMDSDFNDFEKSIDSNTSQQEKENVDVSRVPELLFVVVTIFFLAVLFSLYMVKPEGIPLPSLKIFQQILPFYLVAIFILILVIALFTAVSLFRLFIRRKLKMTSEVKFYFRSKSFDAYWMMITIHFISMCIVAFGLGWLQQSYAYCSAIIFLDLYLLCYLNFQTHFRMNDYELLQDIAVLNSRSIKRNKAMKDQKVVIEELRAKIRKGEPTPAVGAELMTMAVNMLQARERRLQEQQLIKKLEVEDDTVVKAKTIKPKRANLYEQKKQTIKQQNILTQNIQKKLESMALLKPREINTDLELTPQSNSQQQSSQVTPNLSSQRMIENVQNGLIQKVELLQQSNANNQYPENPSYLIDMIGKNLQKQIESQQVDQEALQNNHLPSNLQNALKIKLENLKQTDQNSNIKQAEPLENNILSKNLQNAVKEKLQNLQIESQQQPTRQQSQLSETPHANVESKIDIQDQLIRIYSNTTPSIFSGIAQPQQRRKSTADIKRPTMVQKMEDALSQQIKQMRPQLVPEPVIEQAPIQLLAKQDISLTNEPLLVQSDYKEGLNNVKDTLAQAFKQNISKLQNAAINEPNEIEVNELLIQENIPNNNQPQPFIEPQMGEKIVQQKQKRESSLIQQPPEEPPLLQFSQDVLGHISSPKKQMDLASQNEPQLKEEMPNQPIEILPDNMKHLLKNLSQKYAPGAKPQNSQSILKFNPPTPVKIYEDHKFEPQTPPRDEFTKLEDEILNEQQQENKQSFILDDIEVEKLLDQDLYYEFEGGEKDASFAQLLPSPKQQQIVLQSPGNQSSPEYIDFQNENAAPLDTETPIIVDPDKQEDMINVQSLSIEYKIIPDWRAEGRCWLTAFFMGKLRRNDYHILISQLLGLIAIGVGAFLTCRLANNLDGVSIFVPFIHYGLAAQAHMRSLSTDSPMNCFEHFLFSLAYLIQYGWGVANLFIEYHFATANYQGMKIADTYIVVNLLVIPFITSLIAAIAKWLDQKGKPSPFYYMQLVITLIQGAAIIVCSFVFSSWQQGVVLLSFSVVILYTCSQCYIYFSNDFHLPLGWKITNIIIVSVMVLSSFTISLVLPDILPIFLGFSISAILTGLILLAYGFLKVYASQRQLSNPVFYSPWVFPVYRYKPKRQDVSMESLPVWCLFIGFQILIAWAVLASLWIRPAEIGITVSILLVLLFLLALIYICQLSQLQMNRVAALLDRKTIRRAWLDAKSNYILNRNVYNRKELVTYEELLRRRDAVCNQLREIEGRPDLTFEERLEGVELNPSTVYENEIKEMEELGLVDIYDKESFRKYSLELENQMNQNYREELELIIMFQLLLIQHTEVLAEQKKKYLFTFLTERRSLLLALDIIINIPQNSKFNVQYAKVIQQIQHLSPEQQAMFNVLRQRFIQDQRAIEERKREQAIEEEKKSKEREERLAELQRAKRELKSLNEGKETVDWVDCKEKYQRLLEEFRVSGDKFRDPQFPPENASLGDKIVARGITKWVRASQHPKKPCMLYKETVSALDIKQGQLGDCYFLSAISVLGEKNVRAMIVNNPPESWQRTGCFCVRFFKEGKEEYVVIDDYFPILEGDKMDWAFANGGANGEEIWPMVLEKAYAKLFGGYQFIEAGKVQYALADMVRGFPEQLDLRTDGKNLDVFWNSLLAYKRQGAIMGAGSPENVLGDAAINQKGIVQGHAYAVLDVQEIDGSKLIQLRNPHGQGGAEWEGDWSDTCPNWTQRAKNKLKYQPRHHEDGVFWMDAFDFVQEYSFLYVCRILQTIEEGGVWKRISIEDQWIGESAEGLQTRANPNAKIELNPQYEIVIHIPCDAFILLQQKADDNSAQSTFRGKQSIFFMVSKNKGKRVAKIDKNQIIAKSGNPINLNIVSSECQFDKSVSYPYKFTLMVANTNHGKAGEGKFEIIVYSKDAKMLVRPLPKI